MSWPGHANPLASQLGIFGLLNGKRADRTAQKQKQAGYKPPVMPEAPKKTPWLQQDGALGLDRQTLLMGGLGLLTGDRRTGPAYMLQSLSQGIAGKQERMKEQERQAQLDKFKGTLTPEQAALFDIAPQAVAGGMAERMFAQTDPVEYDFMNVDGVGYAANPRTGTMKALTERRAERPASGMVQDENGNWVYNPSYLQGQMQIRAAGRDSVNVNLPGGEQQFKPLDQYGPNEWIPPSHPHLEGVDFPDDAQAYGTGGQPGMPFRFETLPNTPTSDKNQMRDENRTVGSMISSYATLYDNNAIASLQRGNNLPGMWAGTGVGQFHDRMGKDFGGNPENAAARDQLGGLRMGALMNMISMSDVSARAMDSDAEMKAWLQAIEGDVYESALLKLHVLDMAYGTGTELDKALTDGIIDRNTYDYVQQQVRNDPGTRSKLEKAQVLARVDRAVANGSMTDAEAQELLMLEGWGIDRNAWDSWTPGAVQ